MNKIIIYFLVLIFGVTSLLSLYLSNTKEALAMNRNNIMSDGDFVDWQTMDADGIQWFLDTHGSSRIRNFREGSKTAAQIIYTAAIVNRINPYVILATIQKEESIIESNVNFDYRVKWAMGYGVCDSCDSNNPDLQGYAGFTKQVMDGTWQLKRNYSYWANTGTYKVGNTITIDGVQVTIGNRATSSLYRYTPHFHGNEKFIELYNRYKTYIPPATYDAKFITQVPRAITAVRPGQRIRMLVALRNNGTAVWRKDGANAMHLGNWSSQDRDSVFTGNTNQRWLMLQPQVRRRGVGTFTIWFTAPQQEGTYVEKFRPVMEGINWFGPEITYTFRVTGSPLQYNTKTKTGSTVVPAPTSTPFDKRSLIR